MPVTVEGVREHMYAYRVWRMALRALPVPDRLGHARAAERQVAAPWVREMAHRWGLDADAPRRTHGWKVERWRCRACRTWRIGDRATHGCRLLTRRTA